MQLVEWNIAQVYFLVSVDNLISRVLSVLYLQPNAECLCYTGYWLENLSKIIEFNKLDGIGCTLWCNILLRCAVDTFLPCIFIIAYVSQTPALTLVLRQGYEVSVKELDSLLPLLVDKKKKMEQQEAEANLQIMHDFLYCLKKQKLEELNEVFEHGLS